jgi:site-specific DNA recombinase
MEFPPSGQLDGNSILSHRACVTPKHDQRCPARYSPAQQLDTLVWQDLCEILTHPKSIAYALERAHGGHWLPQDLQARKEVLRKGHVSLANQVERLPEAYLRSVMPLVEYQRRRQELEQKQQALVTQERQLEAQGDRHGELARMVTSMEAFYQRVQAGLANATFEQQRTLVELLVDRVLVANGEVEIRYVIPTHSRSATTRFCHLRKDYFQMIIQVAVGPVRHPIPEDAPDGTWVSIMAISGNAVRHDPRHRPGRAEERLGCREIPRIAQLRID